MARARACVAADTWECHRVWHSELVAYDWVEVDDVVEAAVYQEGCGEPKPRQTHEPTSVRATSCCDDGGLGRRQKPAWGGQWCGACSRSY